MILFLKILLWILVIVYIYIQHQIIKGYKKSNEISAQIIKNQEKIETNLKTELEKKSEDYRKFVTKLEESLAICSAREMALINFLRQPQNAKFLENFIRGVSKTVYKQWCDDVLYMYKYAQERGWLVDKPEILNQDCKKILRK